MREIIRFWGFGILFASGCLLGNSAADQYCRRWKNLRDLSETLMFLEKEMIHRKLFLKEVLWEVSQHTGCEVSRLMKWMVERMNEEPGAGIRELWQQGTGLMWNGIFSEKQMNTVNEIGNALAGMDRIMLTAELEKNRERITEMCREAEMLYLERAGLYRRLGAAAGVFMVLILL